MRISGTERKLRRITEENIKRFGGVSAGFAYWLGTPVWFVRVCWILAVLSAGIGLLPYLVLWICMPVWEQTPEDFAAVTGD